MKGVENGGEDGIEGVEVRYCNKIFGIQIRKTRRMHWLFGKVFINFDFVKGGTLKH